MTTLRNPGVLIMSVLAVTSGFAFHKERGRETSALDGLRIATSPSDGLRWEPDGVEATRTESLKILERKLKDRHCRKEELVTMLLAGQTNLQTVTEAYIKMNRDWSEVSERITSAFPGESLLVGTARTVLQRAEGQLMNYPLAERLMIKERLREEFNCLLRGS